MAHRAEHRKITAWILEDDAVELEQVAKRNERSLAAEVRIALRVHLEAANKLRPDGKVLA